MFPDQLKNLKQPLSQLSHEFPGLNPSRKVQAKAPAWDDSWIAPTPKGNGWLTRVFSEDYLVVQFVKLFKPHAN